MSGTGDEHGIDGGVYSLAPSSRSPDGMAYAPVLICLCGYRTGAADTWEEAGRDLDDHLSETPPEGGAE